MTDVLTKEQRHRNMSNIKSHDTKIEVALRKALWNKGIRYRKNYKKVPGKPDIAITKYRIAIFCDGEYFHGKDWKEQKKRIERGDNAEFWIAKIEKNIQRDSEVDKQLKALDWVVLRFWGKDILKNTDSCVQVVEEVIFSRKMTEDYWEQEERIT
nr:MAG TPA: Vsr [Caudoviricetes sp.]